MQRMRPAIDRQRRQRCRHFRATKDPKAKKSMKVRQEQDRDQGLWQPTSVLEWHREVRPQRP